MPSKYRDFLNKFCSGQLVVTIDRGPCLLIYPLPTWEEVEQDLVRLSSTNKDARLLKRLLIGHAEECQMDNQGRILLSSSLRTFADLRKRVALVGQGNRFELWDEQAWYQIRKQWQEEGDEDNLDLSAVGSLSF